tara:strand:- start:3880 stop:4446 length:567 start_codon:yes stop_codon:yes gene_type:complete
LSDKFAKSMTAFFRFIADTFFAKRYGHRAVVLETIAGVPGIVAGVWLHMKSLRKMQPGMGPKIREMLEEAENERMHLMIFIDIAKPNAFERWLVLFAQFIFIVFYFILFVFFPKTAHRMIHYFEREAVISYTHYLKLVDDGEIENIPATKLAKQYYNLKDDATLRDIIIKIRADEEKHAQVNYRYSLD